MPVTSVLRQSRCAIEPQRVAAALLTLVFTAATADAQTASRVIRAIDERCAICHGGADDATPAGAEAAPPYATLQQLAPETILQAVTTGAMRVHADGLSDDYKLAMAEFISGRKLGPLEAGEASNMPNRCSAMNPLGNVTGPSTWNGWGPDSTNARYQANPGLTPTQIPSLTLKWAFGFPGVSSVYGQPTVVGERVFVGVDSGYVYALNAKTGCVHWSFLAESGVRNAVSVGVLDDGRHAAFFGDIRANVYAIDADSGSLLWKIKADAHPLAVVTGAPTFYEDRLYVPVSSREEAAGGSLNYPCCTFRGSIVALDAATGDMLWKTYPVLDEPTPRGTNSRGTQLWTSNGAAIWHAPTVDPDSRAVYVATGDAYSHPAHPNTDAVMAIHMDTGEILWSVQDWEDDAWLVACGQEPSENCPEPLGPDFDFGTSPILQTLPNGRRVLLAGQKSGFVFGHDPDDDGRRLWRTELVEPAGAAEILFGGAADDRSAYFGLDNGTLAALDPATGAVRWSVMPLPDSARGITAAVTAIPGAVFAGWRGGVISAHDSETGEVLWQFDMLREFHTVNGVTARGGGMGAPGPTVSGGMVYVGSGYVGLGGGIPGNVLLAYGPQ